MMWYNHEEGVTFVKKSQKISNGKSKAVLIAITVLISILYLNLYVSGKF